MTSRQSDLRRLPANLPVPEDDVATAHLPRRMLPPIELRNTRGDSVRLDSRRGNLVIYCYPMMAARPESLPPGWDDVPGARGCTVQAIAYRDKLKDFVAQRATVFGVSLEDESEQAGAAHRLALTQTLLSDADQVFTRALGLPTFEIEGRRYLRRLTLGVHDRTIERVWYPIFPPGQEIGQVLNWLKETHG
jgi:peroxiredoxin